MTAPDPSQSISTPSIQDASHAAESFGSSVTAPLDEVSSSPQSADGSIGDSPELQLLKATALEKRPATVRDILNDPITSHMKTAAPLLRGDQTVIEALDMVRSSTDVGRVVYFYVVDQSRRLQGVVPTRKLLLSPTSTKIADIMSDRMITISSSATV
ncbi:MAG TPA: magnesium transporter, partial [Schlesneria sp.]